MLKIAYSKLAQICPEMAVKVDEDRRRLKAEKPAKSKLSISALRAIKALPKSNSQSEVAKKQKAEKMGSRGPSGIPFASGHEKTPKR